MNRQQRRAAKSRTSTGEIPSFLVPTLQAAAEHCKAGRLSEALAAYRSVVSAAPKEPLAHCGLGGILVDLGHFDEAIAACRRAIALKPDLALAHFNLARALQQVNLISEAAAAYRKAMDLDSSYLGPMFVANLGTLLHELGSPSSAVEMYQLALRLDANYVDARFLEGVAYQKMNKTREAIASLQQAREQAPDRMDVLLHLCKTRREICAWDGLSADDERLLEQCRRDPVPNGLPPFAVLMMPSNATEQFNCARTWARRFQIPEQMQFQHSTSRPKPRKDGRVRIGYMSSDFFDHATAFLISELIEVHDRTKYEIIAYSHGPDDGSPVRKRLVNAFDRFTDIGSMSDTQAARKIYSDEIDILVDLKGYTLNDRPRVFAHRPAPILVSYLGYPGTTGANYIDYVIGDPFVTPMNDQHNFSEKIVQLPNSYQPNDTKRRISDWAPTRAECGLPEDGFVFCCFNNSYKLTPSFFDIWMRVLAAVPDSVLWLIETGEDTKLNLRREASSRGIDPDRLVFAPKMPLADHLARHRLADVFLDTLPVNAHTTASDALWAGLPVVTCLGNSFVGRVGASLLNAVGLSDLITSSLEEYEELALKLALNPDLIRDAKERLHRNRLTTPLFDIVKYTRHLEDAFDHMIQRWRSGEPPEAFTVAP